MNIFSLLKSEKNNKKQPEYGPKIIDLIDRRIEQGNFGEARFLIQKEIELHRGRPDLRIMDRYYQLLKRLKIDDEILIQGQAYVDQLIDAKLYAVALPVYKECRLIDPLFSPSPQKMIKLAGWLTKQGFAKEAINTYQTFTKVYVKNELLPTVYLRAAEIFNESLDQKTKAKTLLESVVKRYPNHDLIPSIRSYLSHIRA